MRDLKIEAKLNEIENRIDYLRNPKLRADAILRFFQNELKDVNKYNLTECAKQYSTFYKMMNKLRQIPEIEIAILHLTNFMESASFNLLPAGDDELRFIEIKERLNAIVYKFENNGQLLHSE
jgi:hypothetical protein